MDSVLKQSYSDFEIIIVDDGSTDDTSKVIQSIKDERIRYFYKENGGLSITRNFALGKTGGEYIAFLDDDDIWPEDYLGKMVSALEENLEYGVAYSLFKNYHPDGSVEDGFLRNRFISGYMTIRYYKKTPCLLPSATIFRKSVCENVWFDEALKNYEDQDYLLRISAKTKFLFVIDTCVKRRVTPGSLSKDKLSYNALLVFERFYFHLGGEKLIPRKTAHKKISEHYRGLARIHYKEGNRKAAVELLKKAVRFYPYYWKNYRGLLKALLLSSKTDKLSGWQMPEPLPNEITVNGEMTLTNINRL
jgi:glycosyltransferase involved in cell wall biosynthesis